MESSASCTAVRLTLTDGQELLIVQVAIDCPACGPIRFSLAGHHLRLVRDMLIQQIDQHPDLTGKDSDVRTIENLKFGMGGPPRPEHN